MTNGIKSIELPLVLIPYYRAMPGVHPEHSVTVTMPQITEQFIPVFSSEELLSAGMASIGITEYKIKEIDNLKVAIASIKEQGCRIMLDPHVVDGKTRWTELGREEDEEEIESRPERRRS